MSEPIFQSVTVERVGDSDELTCMLLALTALRKLPPKGQQRALDYIASLLDEEGKEPRP